MGDMFQDPQWMLEIVVLNHQYSVSSLDVTDGFLETMVSSTLMYNENQIYHRLTDTSKS